MVPNPRPTNRLWCGIPVSRTLLAFARALSCVRSSIASPSDSPGWKTFGFIWYRSSTELVSRELHGNEAGFGSYNPSMGVQRKRANIVNQNRPLDRDSDRSSRRHLVCGRYQNTAAADVHRPARALYLLSPSDCITGIQRNGEANSASTFWSIEGTRVVPCSFHRSSTRMNVVPQRVTYFTEVEPAMLSPLARSITRVCRAIRSRTST